MGVFLSDFDVSVVIANFNSGALILKALDSCLLQTHLPLEIIVVDDCSSDKSPYFIDNWIKINVSISSRLIRLEKNLGPGNARNVGIIESKGKFIAFLDSDDYWLPWHLATAWQVFKECPSDFCLSSTPLVEETQENAETTVSLNPPKMVVGNINLLRFLIIQRGVSTPSCIIPKDLILRSGLFPTSRRYAEDFEFFLKIRRIAKGWISISSPKSVVLGKHFWDSGSGLSSNHLAMYRGTLIALRRAFPPPTGYIISLVLEPWYFFKFLRRITYILFKKLRQMASG